MTVKEIERALSGDLSRHRDIGLINVILDLLLEPRNPFNPKLRRRPRKLSVLVGLVVLAFAGCFWYFTLTG